MTRLDDPRAVQELDPGGMLQQVADLPEQLARAGAVRTTIRSLLPDLSRQLERRSGGRPELLVCGMGGSGIGGDYAAAWAADHGARVSVHRGPGLPAWVRGSELLVFSSYSGDTEETLYAFDAAGPDALRVCLTTGGALAARARAAGVPVVPLPPGLQPRAALGHSLVALLLLLHEAGLVDADPAEEIAAAARALRAGWPALGPAAPEAENRAKRLARAFHGRVPWVCTGPGILLPVGRRWKTQFHENAKAPALLSELPEMHHNEIMAFGSAPELHGSARLVFLREPGAPSWLERRMRLTAELLAPRVAGVEWVEAEGDSRLSRMLTATQLGDASSVYLAFLKRVDPTPVETIRWLKERLARQE